MRLVIAAAFALLVPVSASAQVCLGGSDISRAQPNHFTGSLSLADGETGLTAGGLSGNDGFFGGAEGTVRWFEVQGQNVTPYGFNATFGVQVPAKQRRISVCPVFHLDNSWASDIAGTGVNLWVMDIHGGGAFGAIAVDTRAVKLVPTVYLGFVRSRASASRESASEVESETQGVLRVGAGIVMHQRFTLTPLFVTTFGGDLLDSDQAFVLRFSVNFPR